MRPRKIHQDGIRFQGFRYIDPVLAAYVGETVSLREIVRAHRKRCQGNRRPPPPRLLSVTAARRR